MAPGAIERGEVAVEEELGALCEPIRAGSIGRSSAFVFRDARSLVKSLSSSSELSLSSPPTAVRKTSNSEFKEITLFYN